MAKRNDVLGPRLTNFMNSRRGRVDKAMDGLLPPAKTSPKRLHEALRYSVFAGGKRIRPILCLLACRAAGGREATAMAPACSLEFVHTYSLIHDDLPSMDDDDFRRGKLTSHKKFGEATAILAGDALLTLAFEVISTRVKDPLRAMSACRTLSVAIGTLGMVGGQVLDIEGEGKRITRKKVSEIHRLKTGRLIEASSTMGAIMAGATRAVENRLSRYGAMVGLAFQIVDDILDEEGSTQVLGKTSGRDRELKKMTYPSAYGLEGARRAAKEAVESACDGVTNLEQSGLLVDFARLILHRNA